MCKKITDVLFKMSDEKHANFSAKLMPTIDPKTVLGIKTPLLRKYAAEIYGTEAATEFMQALPHNFFEENNLHAFLIERINNFDNCIEALEKFLPYVDNWATCDSMRPKVFKRNLDKLEVKAKEWIKSTEAYTVRFGIEMFMVYFLDENFSSEHPDLISKIYSDEYYVKMMIAWYFATALAKQYYKTMLYLENNVLDIWTHNKTIQKAVESYRITKEQKEYLKTLKR